MRNLKSYEQFDKLVTENRNSGYNYDDFKYDFFTMQYLCGRSFRTESDALEYLASIIKKADGRTLEDFIVIDKDDRTLKPFKIYPKLDENLITKNEIREYLKEKGIWADANLTPMKFTMANTDYNVVYLRNRDSKRIKDSNIKYIYKPLSELDFLKKLKSYFKNKIEKEDIFKMLKNNHKFDFLTVSDDRYNLDLIQIEVFGTFNIGDSAQIRTALEEIIFDFNNIYGTNYYLDNQDTEQSDKSIEQSILKKLSNKDGKNYTEYKKILFELKRGSEDEYLCIVPVTRNGLPFLKDERISV